MNAPGCLLNGRLVDMKKKLVFLPNELSKINNTRVAFAGGVDSSLLTKLARDTLVQETSTLGVRQTVVDRYSHPGSSRKSQLHLERYE